VKIHKLD